MADGKVVISIVADATGFNQDLDKVEASANDLASKGLKVLEKSVAAVSTALVGGLTAATVAGSAYETAFAQTMTIMDQNVESAGDMSAAIMRVSDDTGKAAKTLSTTVYDAISATGDTANAVGLVYDATKLATAGFSETGDALSVLTTITNAYNMQTDQAAAISDSLIQTQNLGVTTVGKLASTMGKAIASAAAYSVNLYNLEAGYVALTKAGISTEENTTYLSSMFRELGDSGTEVAKIITQKTGKSFGQLMKDGASLGDVLDILLGSVNGDTEALMNLWGSAEAGKAASAIASQGIQTFNTNLNTLQNSAGLTETAYATMADTLSFQTDRLKTRVQNLGITIYDYFSSAAKDGVGALSDSVLDLTESIDHGALAPKMEEISASVQNLIATGSDLAADVLPALIDGAIWILDNGPVLVTGIGAVTAAMVAYKVATTAVTLVGNPFALAVAGVVGLSVALGGLVAVSTSTLSPAEELADRIETNASAADALATAITETNQAFSETRDQVESNVETNDALITQLVSMAASYDGSASSALRMQDIVDRLNSAVPGLNLEFDKQTGTLNRTEDAMRAVNEQYAAQQQYEAAIANVSDMLDNEAEATENLEAARTNLADAQKRLTEFEEEHTHVINGNRIANSGYELSWKNAKKAVDDATKSLGVCQQNVDNAKGAVRTARTYVDQYGDALDEAADAVDALADSEAEAEAQAAATRSEILAIASAAVDARYSSDDLHASYDSLTEQLDALRESGDAEAISLAEQKLRLLDIAATNQDVVESYIGYVAAAEAAGVSLNELSAWIVDNGMTAEEWGEQVDSATSGVINSFGLLDTSLDMSLDTMASNLQQNITAYNNWTSNIQTLMAAATASGNQAAVEFVQYMADMGVGAATQVQAMVDDVDYTMATFPPLMEAAAQSGMMGVYTGVTAESATVSGAAGEVMDAAAGAIEGADLGTPTSVASSAIPEAIEGQIPKAEAAGKALADGVASGVSKNTRTVGSAVKAVATSIKTTDFTTAGRKSGLALSTGLLATRGNILTSANQLATGAVTTVTSQLASMQNAGRTLGNAIGSGLSSTNGTLTTIARNLGNNSVQAFSATASAFSAAGGSAAASLASGLRGGSGNVSGAASSVAQAAYSAMQIGGWYGLGYNISAGVASGVRGGSGLIASAARNAAQSALSTAKKALGVHSPSRVFRDEIGKQIPAGLALGIAEGTPKAQRAVELTSAELLAATKAALRPSNVIGASQYITNTTTNNSYHGAEGGGTVVVEAPLYLDGREIARASAKYTGRQMAYLEGL